MNVSVIIVNYNTKDMTKDCIDSIFTQTFGIEFEVILVDNNSNDGSEIYFASDKRIVFVEAGSNLGFGRANNLGVKKSQGKYIFFLNSDTVLLNNAIKEMFDWMEAHQQELNVGALGCLLSDKNHTRAHSYGQFPDAWGDFLFALRKRSLSLLGREATMRVNGEEEESSDYFKVDYITGADLFVNKETIDTYGGFDPDFFMYFEETEMQYRWRTKGLYSYIIKTPRIIHLEGGSQQKAGVRRGLRNFHSNFIYYRKTMNVFSYGVYRLLYAICYIPMLFRPMDTKTRKELFRLVYLEY